LIESKLRADFLATQAKRDYYEMLGVARTASEQEIKSTFDGMVAGFHASGKPKTIDDVEWLRRVVTAYKVLGDSERRQRYDQTGDDSILNAGPQHGYDPAELERMEREVDQEIAVRRGWWIANYIRQFLG
jgi:molecular chaperone DnaJ